MKHKTGTYSIIFESLKKPTEIIVNDFVESTRSLNSDTLANEPLYCVVVKLKYCLGLRSIDCENSIIPLKKHENDSFWD